MYGVGPEVTKFQCGVLRDLVLNAERPVEDLGSNHIRKQVGGESAGLCERAWRIECQSHRTLSEESRTCRAPRWSSSERACASGGGIDDRIQFRRGSVGDEVLRSHVITDTGAA